jgi:RND family efflux transporter MFP subunit
MVGKIGLYIKRRAKLLFGVAILTGIGFIVSTRIQGNSPKVTTVAPEYQDIVEKLDISGNVDAHEKANLRFAAPSKLTWLRIKEGNTVKKWQAIAGVDARQLQKQLEYNLNLNSIQFRTTEGVMDANDRYDPTGLTETQRRALESSELQLRNTVLNTEIQDIAVKNATMVSPIDGIVTQIDQPNVGATVLVTDMIQIVNPTSVYFAVIVDEADIAKVVASQAATIVLDAYSAKSLRSEVETIAYTPSQSQNGGLGYKVNLTLPGEIVEMPYRLGMSGDANIILRQKTNVLSVSTDAIVERQGEQSVQVLRNGKPEKRVIETGISDGNFTEVVAGLTTDDQVILPEVK